MMAASSRKSFRAIVSSCREQENNRSVMLYHTVHTENVQKSTPPSLSGWLTEITLGWKGFICI
jgi:hypothetical protein